MGEKRARRTNFHPSFSTPLESRWKYLLLCTHSIAELELLKTSLKKFTMSKWILKLVNKNQRERKYGNKYQNGEHLCW
jgi:hypothetical protein